VNQEEAQSLLPDESCPASFDEKFLIALYNGLVEAVFAIEIASRCVVYWNKGAEALFDYRADEMLRQTAEKLFPDESSADRYYGIAVPEIEAKGFWRGEWEYRRRDGLRFIGEATATLLRTDRERYATVVVRDVTDRKEIAQPSRRLNQRLAKRVTEAASQPASRPSELEQSDSERRQTEQLLDVLLRNLSNYAIIILSSEGQVIHWNKETERVLGYPAGEVEGTHLSNFYRAKQEQEEKWKEILERAKVQDSFRDYDCLLRRDGSPFYARIEVFALRDRNALNGYMLLLRDDTEQRKIRERLKDKEHMAAVGTATAMLAHEIKNPLNGMSTTVQLLERSLRNDSPPSKEIMVDTVQDLKNEIGRLQSLLADFQAISHPQRLNIQPVELVRLMRELTSLVMPGSLKQKIRIVEHYAADLPHVHGDPDKLKQAFINLIKNACEAMPHGGTLTTKAYPSKEGVTVEIIDTGEGVRPDLDIFELFSSTKSDGTGLGLVIVRQIILAHNGSIEYSSNAGAGTTFRVILPFQSPYSI
jgi:two-component system, sporulation sensor kinase E